MMKTKIKRFLRKLRYSYSWSLIATVGGTAGLAIIGVPELRAEAREWMSPAVWQWGSDNVIAVIVILALLAVFPAQFAVGARKVEQLERDDRSVQLDTRKNLELTTLASSYSSRIAHLITKAGDVRRGEVNDRYISHTLADARTYFKERAMHSTQIDPAERVELVLYRANWPTNGRSFFDRQAQTHTETNEFPYKLTSYQNLAAAKVIRKLVDDNYFFTSSESELDETRDAFGILSEISFKQFVGVPVYRSRKGSGQGNITGLLMMMSTRNDMLREPDYRLLATYAWFISAAKAIDSP